MSKAQEREQRLVELRRLADLRLTAAQIAPQLSLTANHIRVLARENGIKLTRHKLACLRGNKKALQPEGERCW